MLLANPKRESYRGPVIIQPMQCTPAEMGAGARVDWQSMLLSLRPLFLGCTGAEGRSRAASVCWRLPPRPSRAKRRKRGGRREFRGTGLPVAAEQVLLPDPAARTFLTRPGPAWQPSRRRLRLGRQSSARTCSFGIRADDLDHLGRLYPPEGNMGGPSALLSDRGQIYQK